MSKNALELEALDRARIAGFKKHFPATAVFVIGEVSYTRAEVIQVYEKDLNSYANVGVKAAGYHAAVAEADLVHEATASFDKSVKKLVLATYGGPPGPAEDFGLQPSVLHPPTAAVKAEAVLKREATRVARHTMGPRQKLAITGTVPASPAEPSPAVNGSSHASVPAAK